MTDGRTTTSELELKNQIRSYRINELQALLTFAHKNKNGRKQELQGRCFQLLKENRNRPEVLSKVKELYDSRCKSRTPTPLPTTTTPGSSNLNMISVPGNRRTVAELISDSRESRGGGYGLGRPVKKMEQKVSTIGNTNQLYVGGQIRPLAASVQGVVPVPTYPNLKMRELPFLEVCSVLMAPTAISPNKGMVTQSNDSIFNVGGRQIWEIKNFLDRVEGPSSLPLLGRLKNKVRIMLRLCSFDPPGDEDEKMDFFPPNMLLSINGQPIPLPKLIPSRVFGVPGKRASKPLDITNWIQWPGSHTVTVTWDNYRNIEYAVLVYAAYQLTTEDLLQRLRSKEELPEDFTKRLISRIASAEVEENEVCAPIEVSVACPIVKRRIELPCRSITCSHIPCFDGKSFLLMNEKKSKFICPVCNQPLKFDDLRIDGYFKQVLNRLPADAGDNIIVLPDGEWKSERRENKLVPVGELGSPRKRTKTVDGETPHF